MIRPELLKPMTYRDLDYMLWIKLWPCLVRDKGCRGETEAAHTGEHGLRKKAPDIQTLPLCGEHHRGTEGLDSIGPEAFEKKHNIDLKAEALKRINIYLSMGNRLGGWNQ